jgi:hypothetical protein
MHIGVENRENESMMENISREMIQDVLESEEMGSSLFENCLNKPAPLFAASVSSSNPPGCHQFATELGEAANDLEY